MKNKPLEQTARTETGVVSVENPEQVKNKEQAAEVRRLGGQIVLGTIAVGEKYFELCDYIRRNAIAPKLVSYELKQLGLHKVVISKINKVANAADDLWDKFAAKAIGFNKTLQLTRDSLKLISDGSPIEVAAEVTPKDLERLAATEEDKAKELAVRKEEGAEASEGGDTKALRQKCHDQVTSLIRLWQKGLEAGIRLKTGEFDLGGRVSVRVTVNKKPRVQAAAQPEVKVSQEAS